MASYAEARLFLAPSQHRHSKTTGHYDGDGLGVVIAIL
jgi:hypothetical protein